MRKRCASWPGSFATPQERAAALWSFAYFFMLLAGYYVLRAVGSEPLQRITSQPITDAAFFDNVQRGLRFTYAVQAVDKAGNESRASEPVEETAR